MKKILYILLFAAVAILFYLVYAGLFKSVEVKIQNMPGYRVMGIQHVGAYEKIGDAFNRIHAIADEKGVAVTMIGVYFDNPKNTPETELNSLAGLVVSVEDSLKLVGIEGMTALNIPPGTAAVSTFETSGMVSMIIGAIKSYPALTQFVEAQNIAERVNFVYEVYGDGSTEYVMQLAE
jgi:effector-binding domain-containing protein